MICQICIAVAFACLIVAAASDITARMVSNVLCTVLLCDGVILAFARHDILWSLVAAFAVFVPTAILWRHGFLGGGDAKLLASVAFLVPAAKVPSLILTIAMTGGVLAVTYQVMMECSRSPVRVGPTGRLRRIARVERYRLFRRYSIPYAVAISAGAMLTLGQGLVLR